MLVRTSLEAAFSRFCVETQKGEYEREYERLWGLRWDHALGIAWFGAHTQLNETQKNAAHASPPHSRHKPQTTNSTRFSLHHPTSRPDLATTTAQPLRSFSETRGAAVFGGSWRRNSRNREDCPQGLHKQRTHSATQHPHCTHTHAHSSLVLSWLLHSCTIAHAHMRMCSTPAAATFKSRAVAAFYLGMWLSILPL